MSRLSPAAVAVDTRPDWVVRVVSHSGLLYWWPVWLVGLVLSALTYIDGDRMAIVPNGATVRPDAPGAYRLAVPGDPGPFLRQAAEATARGEPAFTVRASGNRDYGMVYVVVLLLVIVGTSSPVRGLASVAVGLFLLVATVIMAYLDVWGWILERLGGLHVEISLAGYLLPSVVLLGLWLVTVFGLDRLRYVRFTPGQFAVHQDLGGAVQVYDAHRVTLRKRRSDPLRHWVLGLGAGDLVIDIPGTGNEIVLPNITFVGLKVRRISALMRIRVVTAGATSMADGKPS